MSPMLRPWGLVVAVSFFVAACATPAAHVATTLSERVGSVVELRGVLKGMGKQGYVVDVDGEYIHLDVDQDLHRHFGDSATVRGTLRHWDPADAVDGQPLCTPEEPCAISAEHYFLTDATIEFDGRAN